MAEHNAKPGRASCVLLLTWLAASTLPGAQASLAVASLEGALTSIAFDSLLTLASDMGVQHFEFNTTVSNPTYPYSPKELKVQLHMYIKYTYWQGFGYVKGFLVGETRDAAKAAEAIKVEPQVILKTAGPLPRRTRSFQVTCPIHSYWEPPRQAAMVNGFEANFTLPDNGIHAYYLMLDLNPGQVYLWQPAHALNQIDGRGINIPPIQPIANPDREVFVVLKPLHNFNPAVFGRLVERHMDYYQTLGTTTHIIYMRRESIPALVLSSPRVARQALYGKLLIIEWDGMKEHEVLNRKYDHRVMFSHALLAFTGLDVHILYLDLDEYLVTPKPELQQSSIQQIIRTCAEAADNSSDIRVSRFNAVCKDCDRQQSEADLWTDPDAKTYPLTRYQLVNHKDPIKRRSLINPNFMSSFNIHYGTPRPRFNSSWSKATCMYLLHLPNMVRLREEEEVVRDRYTVDGSWQEMASRQKVLSNEGMSKKRLKKYTRHLNQYVGADVDTVGEWPRQGLTRSSSSRISDSWHAADSLLVST